MNGTACLPDATQTQPLAFWTLSAGVDDQALFGNASRCRSCTADDVLPNTYIDANADQTSMLVLQAKQIVVPHNNNDMLIRHAHEAAGHEADAYCQLHGMGTGGLTAHAFNRCCSCSEITLVAIVSLEIVPGGPISIEVHLGRPWSCTCAASSSTCIDLRQQWL